MDKKIYWCPNCNVPLLSEKCFKCDSDKTYYCSTDIKPVFDKERIFFEKELNIKLPRNLFRAKNRIIYDGKTLFRYRCRDKKLLTIENDKQIENNFSIINDYNEKHDIQSIKKANHPMLKGLEGEAIKFIKKVKKENLDKINFISFSGGKDSAVTAILVKKANIGDIPLFFSNTTLEFEETIKYINHFAEKYKFELKTEKSTQNFLELCKELGPPSQTYRWCCTVFKAYPVNKYYKNFNDNQEILTYDGIRAAESPGRRKYSQISRIKKIPRQLAAYPILHWREADVWFYLLCNDIDYNPLYELGFTRVGCWACPAASPFNCILRRETHPHIWHEYEKILYAYADKVGRGHQWVDNDYWRLRRPKKDLSKAISVATTHKLCDNEPSFSYSFRESIDEHFIEFLKPFGPIEYQNTTPRIFKCTTGNSFKIIGIINSKRLNVYFSDDNLVMNKKLFEKQITKAINCISCGACIAACPNKAIDIIDNKFKIDDKKCNHCKLCINSRFVSNGCIALNFILTKKILSNS